MRTLVVIEGELELAANNYANDTFGFVCVIVVWKVFKCQPTVKTATVKAWSICEVLYLADVSGTTISLEIYHFCQAFARIVSMISPILQQLVKTMDFD